METEETEVTASSHFFFFFFEEVDDFWSGTPPAFVSALLENTRSQPETNFLLVPV